ncbi:pyridoxal kinase PdxY [Paludibacterium paludis]|uniref:Pyridoxal kinase PdxY n=1 Tax=Paludibacterium paludis TaxID=1225769 RepID=A0A918P5J9_9NEIS|nr:pyridoxal kinase PdxY [Paludibacterium paludis]GGY26190.1 pyridoxal kinase PdxY [Paludibacterium paludis]
MKTILSIQSHVVYGHVGNSAAVFPMQRMGMNVWPVHTVQFSNHTQYGDWEGDALPGRMIGSLVDGLERRGQLARCDAILSGYLGEPEQADEVLAVVRRVKEANPRAVYLCDPVMGHPGKGCFVKPGIRDRMVAHMPGVADVMTPNHFELEMLTGSTVSTLDEAVAACRALLARGPGIILVKHLALIDKPADRFDMLAVSHDEVWLGSRPLYPFPSQPAGVGDLTSGVFLASLLGGMTLRAAFEHTLSAVDRVLHQTHLCDSRELELIRAQDRIAAPDCHYPALDLSARFYPEG